MLFDTHAHYYSRAFSKDRHELLASFPSKGVGLVLSPGSDIPTSQVCIDLAEQYDFLYAAAGIHPQCAGEQLPSWSAKLEAMLSHPRVKAVGELGLDYYWNSSPHPVQQAVMRTQMELAQAYDLPVIVHDREAHQDCLRVVRDYPQVRGVFHCYSGSLEAAKVLVGLGYLISFTGTITFKNARKAPEVIRDLPLESIMIETDAPYMAPAPFRGKRCDSTMVYRMAQAIAEIKGISYEEVVEVTRENGKRLFRID